MKNIKNIFVRQQYSIDLRQARTEVKYNEQTTYTMKSKGTYKIYAVLWDMIDSKRLDWYYRDRVNLAFIYNLPQLPDLTLCTEEELFQQSVVWDYDIDFYLLLEIQRHHNKSTFSNDYNYSLYLEY